MTQNNNGGPAFPVHGGGMLDGEQDDARNQILQGGMTLRDWFAGQALMGLCADPSNHELYDDEHDAAKSAYDIADAMLEARK